MADFVSILNPIEREPLQQAGQNALNGERDAENGSMTMLCQNNRDAHEPAASDGNAGPGRVETAGGFKTRRQSTISTGTAGEVLPTIKEEVISHRTGAIVTPRGTGSRSYSTNGIPNSPYTPSRARTRAGTMQLESNTPTRNRAGTIGTNRGGNRTHGRSRTMSALAPEFRPSMTVMQGYGPNMRAILSPPRSITPLYAVVNPGQEYCNNPNPSFHPPSFTTPSVSFSSDSSGLTSIGEMEAVTTGPYVVDIEIERALSGANPHWPHFLASAFQGVHECDDYFAVVIPFIANCTFILKSTLDLNYLREALTSEHFPQAAQVVSKLVFPKFYWFSGVNSNRQSNPYMGFLLSLPNIEELTLTLHTAGLTAPMYTDAEVARMEARNGDSELVRDLKVLTLKQIIAHYDLGRLLECNRLRVVNLQCIDSPMVAHFSKTADPVSVVVELVAHLEQGFFARYGRRVAVNAQLVTPN
ncbi:hypothetical protein M011DRAFT_489822 [Sporormia fimetaria CBS 119925]|uniref:Uncharacterized protein n=1 Tax=Sporormia fimetaria CBS 119925 TaxID=1340428 RepID=A0A6A6V1T0_9PLEO|nr:hypothetical protein M011DRAFT_489822 [Sporormia fimetaria CBS 119925]